MTRFTKTVAKISRQNLYYKQGKKSKDSNEENYIDSISQRLMVKIMNKIRAHSSYL